jgi:hypothetical protein
VRVRCRQNWVARTLAVRRLLVLRREVRAPAGRRLIAAGVAWPGAARASFRPRPGAEISQDLTAGLAGPRLLAVFRWRCLARRTLQARRQELRSARSAGRDGQEARSPEAQRTLRQANAAAGHLDARARPQAPRPSPAATGHRPIAAPAGSSKDAPSQGRGQVTGGRHCRLGVGVAHDRSVPSCPQLPLYRPFRAGRMGRIRTLPRRSSRRKCPRLAGSR